MMTKGQEITLEGVLEGKSSGSDSEEGAEPAQEELNVSFSSRGISFRFFTRAIGITPFEWKRGVPLG